MNTDARLLAAVMAVLVFMAGCNNEPQTPTRISDAVIAPAEPSTDIATADPSVEFPLPGLKLDFPFHIQSDSTYTQARTGQRRRGVVLEFKEGDLRTVFDRTAAALKEMGYTTRTEPLVEDDVIGQSFYLRGGAYLEVRRSLGARPKDPASVGVVVLNWPIKSAEEPIPLFQ